MKKQVQNEFLGLLFPSYLLYTLYNSAATGTAYTVGMVSGSIVLAFALFNFGYAAFKPSAQE